MTNELGTRRGFITGLLAAAAVPLIASPPLVRSASLMQIRGEIQPWPRDHRWLGLYFIGTDEVALRVDILVGGSGRVGSAALDGGLHAPLIPANPRGLWVPSEKGQRLLDKLHAPCLDALYQAANRQLIWCNQTGVVSQLHTDPIARKPDVLLHDDSLWEHKGWT